MKTFYFNDRMQFSSQFPQMQYKPISISSRPLTMQDHCMNNYAKQCLSMPSPCPADTNFDALHMQQPVVVLPRMPFNNPDCQMLYGNYMHNTCCYCGGIRSSAGPFDGELRDLLPWFLENIKPMQSRQMKPIDKDLIEEGEANFSICLQITSIGNIKTIKKWKHICNDETEWQNLVETLTERQETYNNRNPSKKKYIDFERLAKIRQRSLELL